MTSSNETPGAATPIDAVITWVDGEDPAHKAKLNAFLGRLDSVPEIADPNRFRETGEFAYCVASLLRFAPWLRRIWIVTDNQEPSFMATIRASPHRDRITVVDHREIFAGYERHLPTFNIISIISVLWRVPGLADRFLFLNDDFALLWPIGPEVFFRGDSLVLRGKWCAHHQGLARLRHRVGGWLRRVRHRPAARASNHHGQALAAALAGYRWRYFRVPHVPHPLLKPVLAEYFARHPALLDANLKPRLRATEQFLADALVNHLAMRERRVVIDNTLRTLRFKASHYRAPRLEQLIAAADGDDHIAFTCLQDLETLTAGRRAVLFGWLRRRIGDPDKILAG